MEKYSPEWMEVLRTRAAAQSKRIPRTDQKMAVSMALPRRPYWSETPDPLAATYEVAFLDRKMFQLGRTRHTETWWFLDSLPICRAD